MNSFLYYNFSLVFLILQTFPQHIIFSGRRISTKNWSSRSGDSIVYNPFLLQTHHTATEINELNVEVLSGYPYSSNISPTHYCFIGGGFNEELRLKIIAELNVEVLLLSPYSSDISPTHYREGGNSMENWLSRSGDHIVYNPFPFPNSPLAHCYRNPSWMWKLFLVLLILQTFPQHIIVLSWTFLKRAPTHLRHVGGTVPKQMAIILMS